MTKPEMTIREFLEEVQETVAEQRPDLAEFAVYRLEVMDQQNKNRKNKNSEKREENLQFLPTILALLTDKPQAVKDIKEQLEEQGHELTSSKIAALMRLGADEGQITVIEPEKRNQALLYKLA